MPFVFRKIRRAKWSSGSRPSWLDEGDLQADALGDLRTSNNELSVYIIDDEQSNLERVAAAVAATGDTTANVDYVLLDSTLLTNIGVKSLPRPGETPDDEVNAAHIDLVELSASRLLVLANAFSASGEIGRISEKRIVALITQSLHSGEFPRNKVNLKRSQSFWEALDKL